MIIRDEILVGDGSIGNYVVGFFNCRTNDGENAESKILIAYRALGYLGVKGVWKLGCLDAVSHEGISKPNRSSTWKKSIQRIQDLW